MKDYASLKEYMLNSDDFKLILTPYIAETIAADNISDKLRFSKFSALQKLAGALLRFQNLQTLFLLPFSLLFAPYGILNYVLPRAVYSFTRYILKHF